MGTDSKVTHYRNLRVLVREGKKKAQKMQGSLGSTKWAAGPETQGNSRKWLTPGCAAQTSRQEAKGSYQPPPDRTHTSLLALALQILIKQWRLHFFLHPLFSVINCPSTIQLAQMPAGNVFFPGLYFGLGGSFHITHFGMPTEGGKCFMEKNTV